MEKINFYSQSKLTIQINGRVTVQKKDEGKTPCYSILIPRLAQEVHLKPETAAKVAEALKYLLSNMELEKEIEKKGCPVIEFSSGHTTNKIYTVK